MQGYTDSSHFTNGEGNGSDFRPRPVFIIQQFDRSNIEHIKGFVPMKLNRAMAIDLIKLIDSVELEENEGHLYAFRAQMSNWLNLRKEILNRLIREDEDTNSGNQMSDEFEDDNFQD